MSSINSNNGVSSSFPVPDNSSSNVGKSSKLGNHNISNKGDAKQAESASKSFDAARLAIGRALGGSSVRSSAPLSSRISTSSGEIKDPHHQLILPLHLRCRQIWVNLMLNPYSCLQSQVRQLQKRLKCPREKNIIRGIFK